MVSETRRDLVSASMTEAAVVVESGPNVETRASVESPGELRGGFVVDDDWTTHGAQQAWHRS